MFVDQSASLHGTTLKIQSLHLSELIAGLSYALDLTEGLPAGHCVRSCWIGMNVGKKMGLDPTQLADLYYTLLLKDAGCSSNAARIFEIYSHDDLAVKGQYKSIDTGSLRQLAGFVISNLAPNAPIIERIRRAISVIANGESIKNEVISARCERGSDIAREMGFNQYVAEAIRCLDAHWDGRGWPRDIRGNNIPVGARIALISQVAEVFNAIGGPEEARGQLTKRVGTWFDPAAVQAFIDLSQDSTFLSQLDSQDLDLKVHELELTRETMDVTEERLDVIAGAFARVIDAKSPFTFGHSSRVADLTDAIALQMGLPLQRRRWLHRAALLHDIGKLGVSNAILEKPDKLTDQEFGRIKDHARFSEDILSRIPIFAELAFMASAHHERLDGTGYPRGLKSSDIPRETRMITVADIFDALTAERPYRAAMPVEKALAIMEKDRGTAIDSDCFDALKSTLHLASTSLLHNSSSPSAGWPEIPASRSWRMPPSLTSAGGHSSI